MANIFSRLFNSKKSDSTYQGTKPVTSLSQVPGGEQYFQTLQDRMAGRGVGYGDAYTSSGNPQIQQLHNEYTGYELPELKSYLTAQGRSGGSSGFQQVARSMQDQADKENSITGQLMQRNAEASHADVNNAISGMGSYAQNEAGLVNNRANFDYADNNRQVQENATRTANESKGLNNALNSAGYVAQNYAMPGIGSAMKSLNPFAGQPPGGMGYGGTGYDMGAGMYGNWNPSAPPAGYQSLSSRIGQRGGYR